jgi:hypothetical protein
MFFNQRILTMRKALIALAAGGALAITAAPAFAQYFDQDAGLTGQREANIRHRINQGLDDGDLTAGQAVQLRTELRQIVSLDARYQDEGMTGWELRDLNSRLSLLNSRLNYDLNLGADDMAY